MIERRIADLERSYRRRLRGRARAARRLEAGDPGAREPPPSLEETVCADSAPDPSGSGVRVDWGSLRRLRAGQPSLGARPRRACRPLLHRAFPRANADSITGHVLEVKDAGYAGRFGRALDLPSSTSPGRTPR